MVLFIIFVDFALEIVSFGVYIRVYREVVFLLIL